VPIINNIYFLIFLIVIGSVIALIIDFYSSYLRFKSYTNNNIAEGIFLSDFVYYVRRSFVFFIPPILGYLSIKFDNYINYNTIIFSILFYKSFLSSLIMILIFIYTIFKYKKKINSKHIIDIKIVLINSMSLSFLYYSPYLVNLFAIYYEEYSALIYQLYPFLYIFPALYYNYFYKVNLGKYMDLKDNHRVIVYLFSYKFSLFFFNFIILLILILYKNL
jgi:hypothetical protein